MLQLIIMKKINGLSCIIFITAMLSTHLVNAETVDIPYPYYISLNAGASKLTDRCTNLAVGFTCKDSAPAYSLDGGYQINPYFGLELTFAIYGSPKSSGTVSGSSLDVADEVSGFRFSGTVDVPLNESFALTGRLGYAQTNVNVISTVSPGLNIPNYSAPSNTFAYGAGLKYNINKIFSLHVKYDNIGEVGDDTTGKYHLSQVSAGLSYYFDIAKPRASANNASVENPDTQHTAPATTPPLRVILQLKKSPAANTPELKSAVAQACQCEPYFVRLLNMNSIIYQIALASEQTFALFKEAMLSADNKFGIKDIAQEQQ
jgi:opacity protein-like surface antigen